jgi:hypothetical protein
LLGKAIGVAVMKSLDKINNIKDLWFEFYNLSSQFFSKWGSGTRKIICKNL